MKYDTIATVTTKIMSCNLRENIVNALLADAEGQIQKAKWNVEVYLHNPVGIGEHPDVLGSIQDQLDVIAEQEERIQVIQNHFQEHHH